jgi:hypothetical protein
MAARANFAVLVRNGIFGNLTLRRKVFLLKKSNIMVLWNTFQPTQLQPQRTTTNDISFERSDPFRSQAQSLCDPETSHHQLIRLVCSVLISSDKAYSEAVLIAILLLVFVKIASHYCLQRQIKTCQLNSYTTRAYRSLFALSLPSSTDSL